MDMFYKSPRVNLGRLTPLLQDLKGQIEFLEKTEILPTKQTCTDCDQVLTKRSNKGYFVYYRCTKCSKRISARSGTILSGSKLSFRRFILMVYSFCQFNWTYGQTQQEVCVTSDDEEGEDSESSTQLSSRSINKYFKLFREIVSDHMISTFKSTKKIGGPGCTVEIDESQFGKRKYNRGTILGRRFAWILGGVCRETGEMFLVQCKNNKRGKDTLLSIIIANVEEGTTIYTDGWAAYKVQTHLCR